MERNIKGQKRPVNTKHSVKELRNNGLVPGVLYGKNIGNIPIQVSARDLTKIGGSQIIEISLPQVKYPAMVREIQRHPITGDIQHVDFQQIDMSKEVKSEIPINIVGEAIGLKKGGVLQYGERKVQVEALPKDLPEYLNVDISALDIGDKFTVQDLTDTIKLIITSEPDTVLIQVVPQRQIEDIEESEELIAPKENREKEVQETSIEE